MKKSQTPYYRRRKKVVRPTNRRPYPRKNMQRKLNKKKVAVTIIIFLAIIISIVKAFKKDDVETATNNDIMHPEPIQQFEPIQEPELIQQPNIKNEISDWRLVLANYDNLLPEDFEVELEEIDDGKEFDARAIKDLKAMINAMGRAGISNVWVQSAYRSVARQKQLYENSIQKYLKQGKSQEEAIRLTDEYINKPGASDHNLGLAVDFNNVDNNFEDLKAFKWLKENAEDYGFILRYPKDKEDITHISYESWHWRFVGEEHAKKMNELNMCLEEYIEYLENEPMS